LYDLNQTQLGGIDSRMPVLRVIVLWHQHQPFYKDLVTGEYRLPWVRLHALKDYYGMVKLLDEFPHVHQTFNLVPSLITQIQDYVAGTARDPFLEVAAKPAKDLGAAERRFCLQYLFQANPVHVIGRYPRYRELADRLRACGKSLEQADLAFGVQDFTDLQVLSQIAWFDEFFLQEPDLAELIRKERNYSLDDQKFVLKRERELLAKVLPAHTAAAKRGGIEISTSPFYHPILPLVCDTNQGSVSSPGLPLPQMPASSSCVVWICRRKSSVFARKGFGLQKAAFLKKRSPLPLSWACNGWPPTRAFSGAA
jgi:alpha-amylase/alpha-mannosidase (GH57 family)